MRRGEIVRLTWENVDLARDQITAHSRKQSRKQKETPRTIDLHPDLKPLLVEAEATGGRSVVAGDDGGEIDPDKLNRHFRQPMRNTDWHLCKERFKVGFHTDRHSFAGNFATAGVDRRVVNELTGHTTEEMAKRYRHLIPAGTKAAVGGPAYGINNGGRPNVRGIEEINQPRVPDRSRRSSDTAAGAVRQNETDTAPAAGRPSRRRAGPPRRLGMGRTKGRAGRAA